MFQKMCSKMFVTFLIVSHITKVFGSSDLIECGKSQNLLESCFKDLNTDVKEFLWKTKIPLTEENILNKCMIFQKGIDCFDEYSKKCLISDRGLLYQNNIYGARSFLEKLCKESVFRREYLKQGHCLSYIQDDWQRCSKTFQELLSDELHNSLKLNISKTYMQFCCSRYAYENCIIKSARYKCERTSLGLVRTVVNVLTDEKHFRNCRRYENLLCSAGFLHISNFFNIIFAMFFMWFLCV